MIPQDRERPYLEPIAPYIGQSTKAITVYERSGVHRYEGRSALNRYMQLYDGPGVIALFHGSYKSPQQVGRVLVPQQAYTSHRTGSLEPDGRPAISLSDEPKMPIVRSLFHRDSPALNRYPRDDHLFANLRDISGVEAIIVTKQALDAVWFSTGYVYVIAERQPDGTWAERFREPGSLEHEYRLYQPAEPIFVMPVGVEDLPSNTAIVKDSKTAKAIVKKIKFNRFEAMSEANDVHDIHGNPFFSSSRYTS